MRCSEQDFMLPIPIIHEWDWPIPTPIPITWIRCFDFGAAHKWFFQESMFSVSKSLHLHPEQIVFNLMRHHAWKCLQYIVLVILMSGEQMCGLHIRYNISHERGVRGAGLLVVGAPWASNLIQGVTWRSLRKLIQASTKCVGLCFTRGLKSSCLTQRMYGGRGKGHKWFCPSITLTPACPCSLQPVQYKRLASRTTSYLGKRLRQEGLHLLKQPGRSSPGEDEEAAEKRVSAVSSINLQQEKKKD